MKKVSYLILMVILLIPITVRGKPISVHLKLNESMQEQSISIIHEAGVIYAEQDLYTAIGLRVDYNKTQNTLCIDREAMDKPLYFNLNKGTLHVSGEYAGQFQVKQIENKMYIPLNVLGKHYNYQITLVDNLLAIQGNIQGVESGLDQDVKNIYKPQYLQQLVDTTQCSEEIMQFRKTPNPRRKGLLKKEGKYFDLYYPNTEYGKSVAEFLAPHMDKVYMMLTDLYGIQAKVEVHLIDEKDTKGLREGDIRANEHITYVWLEANNDQGGNNLSEFVHEINHNFFQAANGGATNIMWINEANAKLVPSLYIKHNYVGPVDMQSFYKLEMTRKNLKNNMQKSKHSLSFKEVDTYLKKAKAWGREERLSKQGMAQDYGLCFWNYIYNQSELEDFKFYIRNLGTKDVIPAIEKVMKKSILDIEKEFKTYIDGE